MNRTIQAAGVILVSTLVVTAFQNCTEGFKPLSMPSEIIDNNDSGGVNIPPEQIADGKILYSQNCAACHGAIDSSNKKERTPFQISTAISTLSQMSALRTLSADQINKISYALGYNPNASANSCKGTRAADITAIFRMNKGEYTNTVADLFGVPESVADNFPPDNDGEMFANSAAQLAYASSAQIEQYLYAAEKIVETVFSTNKALIMTCNATSTAPATCAANIIDAWTPKILRRPLDSAERAKLLAMVPTTSGVSATDFEAGIQTALVAALFSPHFLYRTVESSSGAISELNNYEFATRLSYFLWSSTPDAELLNLAKNGTIKQQAQLKTQIARMLASPKAKRLTQNFASRWIGLSRISQRVPDATVYPNYKPSLRTAFEAETRTFFENMFSQNRSLTEIISADYTYVNEELSKHYGIGGVVGTQFQKVSIANTPRRGLASHGSVLMMTSHTDDSSVIQRGKWIMQNLMCDPPPPPPPNVGDSSSLHDMTLTKRQQLEVHRNNASCFSCHARMEPLGFGLENFDAIGAWRTSFNGKPVDNAGALPDGSPFNNPEMLVAYLQSTKAFDQCISKYLMTYAMARKLDDDDDCNVKDIAKSSVSEDKGVADTIEAIVRSDLFTKVKGK
ncbi:hypothetical protein AZI86_03145 [Bdellovibrio bacteriovorus]|uniref:Cytochrome c domain-containing protein n=1 Tax=Bdellovibrio bacteriovorus TaxID=959 RepID=A0A150WP43_BDEBC|nr:DUF1592 domain-containing protein [Bdellovibrio bacteriovorus]KYG66077.1 hypothetical protein AZI86_03145 [Bdellovibrio bacteriovorus]